MTQPKPLEHFGEVVVRGGVKFVRVEIEIACTSCGSSAVGSRLVRPDEKFDATEWSTCAACRRSE